MSVITEVKQRLDIVEFISEYVTLQKAGRNFKGLCPFHSEKHASFFVFPEQQSWHCFGACGAGGDIFSFIMKKEGVDFGQALRLLAQRGGVTLSPREGPSKAEDEKKERLFQISEAAAEYYYHILSATKTGATARSYLAKRNVVPETIKEFRLGFSPDAWETIKNYLLGKGYTEKELVEAGLIIEKEEGGSYDRFRNRLMFPICDIQGRVTGFGARVLDDSLPKYINSPQTPIFDKSNSLYGIDKAKSAIRKKDLVIIVEGYMDVLPAHQHDWKNVVGSMGTSLTEKQVEGIKRLTNNITLALDADLAGEEATLRGKAILAYSNIEANVILLPPGKDPDEVIGEELALWQKLVEQAMPIMDFAFQSVMSKVDTNKARDKSLAVQKLLPSIYEIRDPVQQSHYLKRLARELKIEESAIRAALRESRAGRKRPQPGKPTEQSPIARQFMSSPIEEYCLSLLLQYPELRPLAGEVSPEHFEYTENREVFVKWQHSSDIPSLESKLDTSLLEHLYCLVGKNFPPDIRESEQKRHRNLDDCILRLKEKLFRKLETEKEATLEIEREKGGISSELAKLEEQGIDSGLKLQEIFVKKEKNHGFN
ncbi:MAG: DNA primase [Dehalococcoidia bacterium]|nr:DNA primase [Dehalococcoidia bacterium]MDH4291067.1 DNA primase [Dehalococcoidia bacterium]